MVGHEAKIPGTFSTAPHARRATNLRAMSDVKVADSASQPVRAHQEESTKAQDATVTADGSTNVATVIEVPVDVQDTTKPSLKPKKLIVSLFASLLVAVIFAAFMLLRPKYLITNTQINLAMSFLKMARMSNIDVQDSLLINFVKCDMFRLYNNVESEDEAKSRSLTSFPANKIIPWEPSTPIPAQENEWLLWLKEHPYTALHLYYMAKLFNKYKRMESFTFEGYKAISGYNYLVDLMQNTELRANEAHYAAYAVAKTSISNIFCEIDFVQGTLSYSAEEGGASNFLDAILRLPLQYARYAFVVSRLHAHDMSWYCTGAELHAALPNIFPCVPPKNTLGGSFEDHIGRTVANYALAGLHLENNEIVTFDLFGAWVCAGFNPATGTASLDAVRKYYEYNPKQETKINGRVYFKDFASAPISVKKVAQ